MKERHKKVLVVAPGFVVDCLEAIEELGEENREYFIETGGEAYRYFTPFNTDKELAEIVVDFYRNPTK